MTCFLHFVPSFYLQYEVYLVLVASTFTIKHHPPPLGATTGLEMIKWYTLATVIAHGTLVTGMIPVCIRYAQGFARW